MTKLDCRVTLSCLFITSSLRQFPYFYLLSFLSPCPCASSSLFFSTNNTFIQCTYSIFFLLTFLSFLTYSLTCFAHSLIPFTSLPVSLPHFLHLLSFHLLPSSILVTMSLASFWIPLPQTLLPAPDSSPAFVPLWYSSTLAPSTDSTLFCPLCCVFLSLLLSSLLHAAFRPTSFLSPAWHLLSSLYLHLSVHPPPLLLCISQCLSVSLLLPVHSERWLYWFSLWWYCPRTTIG